MPSNSPCVRRSHTQGIVYYAPIAYTLFKFDSDKNNRKLPISVYYGYHLYELFPTGVCYRLEFQYKNNLANEATTRPCSLCAQHPLIHESRLIYKIVPALEKNMKRWRDRHRCVHSLLANRYSTESRPPSTATAIITIGIMPAML